MKTKLEFENTFILLNLIDLLNSSLMCFDYSIQFEITFIMYKLISLKVPRNNYIIRSCITIFQVKNEIYMKRYYYMEYHQPLNGKSMN